MDAIVDVYAVAPLVVIALAIVVDVRTRRGYGLGILSFLLLVSTGLVIAYITLAIEQQRQHPNLGGLVLGGFILVVVFIEAYVNLSLLIAAAIVAGIASQWRWLVVLAIGALVPVSVFVLPHVLDMLFDPSMIALLAIPQAAVLVFSIARIVRPVAPARQPAPLGLRPPASL